MSFRIAMQGRRAISGLQRPHEIIDQHYGAMILERRSGAQEHLVLTDVQDRLTGGEPVTDGRTPPQVYVGSLVSRGPEPGTETFLMSRYIDPALAFRGLFVPAEGLLRLTRGKTGARLSGVCRLAWAPGYGTGCAEMAIARALNDTRRAVGCVMHLDLAQVAWAGECLPETFRHQNDPTPEGDVQ